MNTRMGFLMGIMLTTWQCPHRQFGLPCAPAPIGRSAWQWDGGSRVSTPWINSFKDLSLPRNFTSRPFLFPNILNVGDYRLPSSLYNASGPPNSVFPQTFMLQAFGYLFPFNNLSVTMYAGSGIYGLEARSATGTPEDPTAAGTISGPITIGNSNFMVNGAPVLGTADYENSMLKNFTVIAGGLTIPYSLTPIQPTSTPTWTQISIGDPVSTASGEFIVPPVVDLSLGGPLPLFLRRSYSSFLVENTNLGILGFNWITNFEPYIAGDGSTFAVVLEYGRVTFHANGSGFQTALPARLPYQLVHAASGGYRFFDPSQNLIYDFNTGGHLIKIEDRNGNALTVVQGAAGPTQVSDGLGRTLSFIYSSAGNLISVTDQSGRSVSYAQNGTILTSVRDANGNTTSYANAGFVDISKITRPLGNAPYSQNYDALGRVSGQTDSEGNATMLSYVAGGTPGLTKVTDPLGRTTAYNYANLIDLSSFTDAAGQTGSVAYDSLNRPISYTDRLGNKFSVAYDAVSGYPASITDAKGNTTTYTYESQVQGDFTFYNVTQIGYADGTKETFSYDGSGNVLTATDRAGKTTTYTYNTLGQALTETNPAGGVTTYTYNADGTVATSQESAANITTYSYDKLKRIVKVQHPDQTSTSFTYDTLDNILSMTNQQGEITKFAYDSNTNLISVTDALNQSAEMSYDTDDLPSILTDPLGNKTTFQYDPLGSVTAVIDAASEKATYTYDDLERLSSALDPSGKGPSFTYDAEGQLATLTDALGDTTKYAVDQLGRTTGVMSPLGENTAIA